MITTTTLKNAAFAIECDLWTDPATGANYLAKDGAILRRWEPETSSADAFDLAADLHFEVSVNARGVQVKSPAMWGEVYIENMSGDVRLTARRAIVLAASGVGAP
jgi:hypothetical protein